MRRTALALATTAVVLAAPSALAADDDPWFGRDKALHFGVSAGVSAAGYAVGTTFLPARAHCLALGVGAGVVVGAAKEGVDALGFGTPSMRDFAWDVAGSVVGAAAAWAVDLALRGVSDDQPALAPPAPRRSAVALVF